MTWHNPLSKAHQVRRKNKFGAQKVTTGEGTFDSKGEHEMHLLLRLLEGQGIYENVRHHPGEIQLIGKLKYKPDWIVIEKKRGIEVAIDFKGVITERFRCIMQVWPECGPMPLQIWKKAGNRLYLEKEIKGK